jgi:predicted ribosomally synthesized peptide with nif11-like leader
MATSTQELIGRLMSDEEFRRRVESAGSAEEARSIVHEAGFRPDRHEAEQIRDRLQSSGTELSEEELNAVLGGTADNWTDTTVWVGLAAAAAAA